MNQTSDAQTEKRGVIEHLIENLSDPDADIRKQARSSLVAIGKPVIISLVNALSENNREKQLEVARTLAAMLIPETAPYLVKALEIEDPDVRWLAAEGLLALGKKALEPLLQALMVRSDYLWLRIGAHHVIFDLFHEEIHDREVLPLYPLDDESKKALRPVLIALESIDHNVMVPPAAAKVLEAISQKSVI